MEISVTRELGARLCSSLFVLLFQHPRKHDPLPPEPDSLMHVGPTATDCECIIGMYQIPPHVRCGSAPGSGIISTYFVRRYRHPSLRPARYVTSLEHGACRRHPFFFENDLAGITAGCSFLGTAVFYLGPYVVLCIYFRSNYAADLCFGYSIDSLWLFVKVEELRQPWTFHASTSTTGPLAGGA